MLPTRGPGHCLKAVRRCHLHDVLSACVWGLWPPAPVEGRGLPTEPSCPLLRSSPAWWSGRDPLGFHGPGLARHHSCWLGKNHRLPGLDLLAGRRTRRAPAPRGVGLAQGHCSGPDPASPVPSKQKSHLLISVLGPCSAEDGNITPSGFSQPHLRFSGEWPQYGVVGMFGCGGTFLGVVMAAVKGTPSSSSFWCQWTHGCWRWHRLSPRSQL